MLKTEQILNAKFTPISKGTYSAEEVDSFLKVVAESYEESLGQNRELMKKINRPVEIDFMKVSSYGSGTSSSGVMFCLLKPIINSVPPL